MNLLLKFVYLIIKFSNLYILINLRFKLMKYNNLFNKASIINYINYSHVFKSS